MVVENNISNLYKSLAIFDHIFAALVLSPLCVGVWRGLWGLEDIYLVPTDPSLSAFISIILGFFMQIFCHCIKNVLKNFVDQSRNTFFNFSVSRLYTVFLMIAGVNSWRGPWYFIGVKLEKMIIWKEALTVFGFVSMLVCLKSLKSACFAPLSIDVDWGDLYFNMPTRFKHLVKEKTSLYIMDCLFSILVVGTLVVFVWRGSWIMLDLLLFPDDLEMSVQGSLVIGYFIILIVFLMQPIVRNICSKLTGPARIFVADLFIIVCLSGTINVWRGIWKSLDLYLLPENPELSAWISLGVSLTLLILLGCSNSLLVRGVYIDAEEPDGKCVVLPCYYFRLIFQAEKLKKLNKKIYSIQQKEKYKESEKNHVVTIGTISSIVEDNDIRVANNHCVKMTEHDGFRENCIM